MLIKTPLKFITASTVIKYPGTRENWNDTKTDGAFLIGNYTGALYLNDGVTKSFEWEFYTPSAIDYGRIVSVPAWRKRYTLLEKSTVDLLSIDDPSATNEARLQQATIRQVLKELDFASEVPLDDPEFQAATMGTCELLKTANLIADAAIRFNELVNAPVQFSELPERLKALYQQ